MAVPAQFLKLLDNCREMELSHLRPLMDRMFENADVALLDFAEKAESNMAQSLFFEAMNAVRKNRPVIEQSFHAGVCRSFEKFPVAPNNGAQAPAAQATEGGLSLVANDAMETLVATSNAAGKLASRTMDRIFALRQRLSVVNGGNAVKESEIPGGPAWLGAAFQEAVEPLELEHKVRLILIALFDKYVLSHAETIYDEFNKRFVDAGVLPHLRYEVHKQPGGESAVAPASRREDIRQAGGASAGEPDDELFGRICELMAVRHPDQPARGAQPAQAGPSRAGDGRGTGSGKALNRLNDLQREIQATSPPVCGDEFIENIEVDSSFIERVRDILASEREKILGAAGSQRLSRADTDVIELVGMLFEYMLKDETLPNAVKALLSRLHTPLLKVAVIDRSFFTNQGHSARRLLNDMTAAGQRWVDETHLDRGIYPRMREIVDKVLLDFKEDVSLFDELLGAFSVAVHEIEQRTNRVEERTNEAASGQEKLQAARALAQQRISKMCEGKTVAQAACDFLQRVVADKLTFTLLRNTEREQSEDWQRTIRLVARIIGSTLPPANETERAGRQAQLDGLQQDIREATGTLQQTEKERLLDALFDLQREVLAAAPHEQPAKTAPRAEPAPSQPAKPASKLSAAHKEMLDKLNTVPFGTWFEFRMPGEAKKRAKLSWRSTVTEKFMFVDQLGVKAAVVGMHDLADYMLDGTASIVSIEKKPFVDRALNAIHRMLDRAA